MEAPIPASSLIHSATLVSAGIFLLLKIKLLQADTTLQLTLAAAACCTVVLGGLATITHTDLKKVLAFSTIANCGLLLLFALSDNVSVCFLYFTVHGVAKACSFFAVGICVLALDHRQDWRTGILSSVQKKTTVTYLLPPLAVLGAWPGTITTLIKYSNFGYAGAGLSQAVIDSALLIGSSTSLVYSTKLMAMLVSPGVSKQAQTITTTNKGPLGIIAAATVGCAVILHNQATGLQTSYPQPHYSPWSMSGLCREVYNFLPITMAAPFLLLNSRRGSAAVTYGLLGFGVLCTAAVVY